jgi:hypothetical protein
MRAIMTSLVVCLSLSQVSLGADLSTDLGVARSSVYEGGSNESLSTQKTQRVRIPVSLKGWNELDAKAQDGSSKKARIPSKVISQVLRARIERANDFYLGQWRIQTTPTRWLKRSNQYQVRLEVFRRHGDQGQVEESLGSVLLTGMLNKQDDGLFVLEGTARRIFRDKVGTPILDLEAGMRPSDRPLGTSISRRDIVKPEAR